jgi:hypothetical protein
MQISSDSNAPSCGDTAFDIGFSRDSVQLTRTPFGLVVDLPEGRADGEPGGPALPVVAFDVALPPGKRVASVAFECTRTEVMAEGELIAPRQPAAPGLHVCSGHGFLREDGLVKAWQRPLFVPPDAKRYRAAVELGRQSAMLTGEDPAGPQSIATVVLRPLVIDEKGRLLLHTAMRVSLELRDTQDEARIGFGSRAQAERWYELQRGRVVNPWQLFDPGVIFTRLIGPAEYLIITDNQRWDATTIKPTGAAGGDLVTQFERLAAWKRTKGLSARVVTITDIVGGAYGHFNGSCRRDLQEVLREFVKFAHDNWGTAWLLLGGDIDILPVRSVVGNAGAFAPQANDPPEPGNSFWTGTFLKIRADVGADTPLIREADGHRIPHDASGSSGPTSAGWYFTDASYTMRSTSPTGFVRVNGPAAAINVPMFWLTGDNTIPTDLYYADVGGYPARSPDGHWVEVPRAGRLGGTLAHLCDGHDWDQVGNALYGQWAFGGDIDGVHYRADISVGRAPAGNADEAKTFVDKVIAYENQGGGLFGAAWLRKLLMVSSNWGGRSAFGAASPLVDNSYIKRATDDHAVIQLAAAPSSFGYKLISAISDTDQRELPYRIDASPAQHGWRFARSATDPAPHVVPIPMPPFPPIQFPMPSRWIVVYGSAAEMAPPAFILDESAGDGSMIDQETLRKQLAADVPAWSNVRRLYEDEIDLSPADASAAPLEHLTADRIETRLDEGQHIVSLSGHGWWGGCCGLQPAMRTSLTNGSHTFIAYADSCLTNQFDVDDAVSESLLQNPTGGAVAYVGNTRFSWIGVGDDFQRNFFKGLPGTTAIGLLHDRRLAMLGAGTGFWPVYNRWSIFALNLIGDPEMRIWTRPPRPLCIDVPDRVRVRQRVSVRVSDDSGHAVPGAVVTFEQGAWRRQQRSDLSGIASLDLHGASAGPLDVVAVKTGHAVVRATIAVRGLVWLDASPLSVTVRGAAQATLTVATGAESRQLLVDAADAELMPLLERAVRAAAPLRLAITDEGRVEAAQLHVDGAEGGAEPAPSGAPQELAAPPCRHEAAAAS